MKKIFILWFLFIGCGEVKIKGNPDAGQETCMPPCRTGYICVKGECVSMCNPPCPPGERCVQGECIKGTKKDGSVKKDRFLKDKTLDRIPETTSDSQTYPDSRPDTKDEPPIIPDASQDVKEEEIIPECQENKDCDDQIYCNGQEICQEGRCISGQEVDCKDEIDCTNDRCNEANRECEHIPVHTLCPSNMFCVPEEGGCISPVPCNSESDCDDRNYCNGKEKCEDGWCRPGEPVKCNDNIDCTLDECSEADNDCVFIPLDALCDNGVFCDGKERCHPDLGCRKGPIPDCRDKINCTDDWCDLERDKCMHEANHKKCDDKAWCNGKEMCIAGMGCIQGTPKNCEDKIDCTKDVCDETRDRCVHIPYDSKCDNGLYCDGKETCHKTLGCISGTPIDCNDNIFCTEEKCSNTLKRCVYSFNDKLCDDGLFCNGDERCTESGCKSPGYRDCSDEFFCTIDTCNEEEKKCVHTPSDSRCSDGAWCNGEEKCDPESNSADSYGCIKGTPVDCTDDCDCTPDRCDEPRDRCYCPVDCDCCAK